MPDGLELYYSTGNNSALTITYGSALPSATWVKAPGNNPFVLKSQTADKHITVALVNKTKGTAVAGGDTTLVVKA